MSTLSRPSFSDLSTDAGFSLIELMVTVSIMAILAAVAAPNLLQWVARNQVRTAAESLKNDLSKASKAADRGTPVEFTLTNTVTTAANVGAVVPAANGTNWVVRYLPPLGPMQLVSAHNGNDGSAGVTVTGANFQLEFVPTVIGDKVYANGLGAARVNLAAPGAIYQLSATGTPTIRLCVYVDPGGAATVCDPTLNGVVGDPRQCTLPGGAGLTAVQCP